MEKTNKGYIIFIAILLAGLSFIMYPYICSDDYFMIAHGKDIIEHGFNRSNDIFSMHNDFEFMHQKWAMCILTYFIYEIGGMTGIKIGTYILNFMLYATIIYAAHKLCPKYKHSLLTICLAMILPISILTSFRPHMFGMIFTTIEIYMIERYIQDKLSPKMLIISLTVTSITWMWFHSTMWTLCPIYMLPYICSMRIPPFLTGNTYKKQPIIIGFITVLLSGLLQPNGIKQISYMISCMSFGNDEYKRLIIEELKPISPADSEFCGLVILILLLIYLWIKNQQIRTDHLLLFLGSLMMTIMAKRMIMYMFCACMMIIASTLNDMDETKISNIIKKPNIILLGIIDTTIVTFMIAMMMCITLNVPSDYTLRGYHVIDMINEHSNGQYTTYFTNVADNGSYGIMKGLHPYVDCRMEVYTLPVNKKRDVLHESIDLIYNLVDHKDKSDKIIMELQDKYHFDYWVINKVNNISNLMIETLKRHGTCVYEDERFAVISFCGNWN